MENGAPVESEKTDRAGTGEYLQKIDHSLNDNDIAHQTGDAEIRMGENKAFHSGIEFLHGNPSVSSIDKDSIAVFRADVTYEL